MRSADPPPSDPETVAAADGDDGIVGVDEVVARVERELRAHPGRILLLTTTGEMSVLSAEFRTELYVDSESGVARQSVIDPSTGVSTTAWLDGDSMVVESPGGHVRSTPLVPCEGMTAVVGLVLSCEATTFGREMSVEVSDDGSLVLVISASVPQATPADPTCRTACRMLRFNKTYTRWISLDPVTLLPTRAEEEGTFEIEGGFDYDVLSEVVVEYIDPADLGPDFFVPPQG